jgi:acyl-coenzyme A thioesterase PaaI-like protein
VVKDTVTEPRDSESVEELDPNIFGQDSPCFGCSPTHPVGLRLRFERVGEEVVTEYTPPDSFQGPPGVLHGGLVLTLADEIAAWTVVGLQRRFGFTGAVEARLKKPVRIGQKVVGRGRIVNNRGRVVNIGVTLHQGEDLVFDGMFTFAVLDVDGAERLLGIELPDAWRRFGRG